MITQDLRWALWSLATGVEMNHRTPTSFKIDVHGPERGNFLSLMIGSGSGSIGGGYAPDNFGYGSSLDNLEKDMKEYLAEKMGLQQV